MNASSRTPHRPRRLLSFLRTRRLTQLGVIETVLAAVLTVVEFLQIPAPVPLTTVVFATLTLVLVACTASFPVAASMLSLVLILSMFAVADVAPLYSIFFTMLVVEVVAASSQLLLAGSLALAHWALSAFDPQAMALSTDVAALTVVALVLAAAYMVGWSRASHGRQQEKLRASLAEQERRQRLELARELHDSVATSLTSVVMQAQALTLLPTSHGDARSRHGLETISEKSREALSNLRTMVQLLNEKPNHTSFRTRTDSPPLSVALEKAQQELEAHSLEVSVRIDLPSEIATVVDAPDTPDPRHASLPPSPPAASTWIDRDTATKVLTEMTSNAAKHALKHSTVSLTCTVTEGTFILSMTNLLARPTGSSRDGLLSGGVGLGSMHARAAKAGGELETELIDPRTGTGSVSPGGTAVEGGAAACFWRATLRLPIVVIKS